MKGTSDIKKLKMIVNTMKEMYIEVMFNYESFLYMNNIFI